MGQSEGGFDIADPIIHIRGLRKLYGPHVALDGVDLDIGTGGVGILGPNGSGKSTLFKCILGLIRITEGGGEVLGREPVEGGGVLKGNAGAEDGPDGEEGGGDVGSLGVGIENLLSEALLLSTGVGGSFGHLHGGALAGTRREGRGDGHRRGGKLLHLNICTCHEILKCSIHQA